ncbi:MAG: 6-bladed beta-propeller [Gemmatimonadaceae bacterium]
MLSLTACQSSDETTAIEPPILNRIPIVSLCAGTTTAEDCQWRSVRKVAWMENGQIAVLDGPHDIHVFSSTGQPLGPLGRTGDGPGEFRFIADLRLSASPAFIALDVRHFRVEAFDAARRVVSSIPVQIRPLASGTKLSAKSIAYLEVDPADSLGSAVPAHVDFLAFDSTQPPRRVAFTSRAQRRTGSEFQSMPRPFAPEVLWDINSNGELAVGYGDAEEVVVFDTLGQLRTTIRGHWPAARVSTAQRDSAATALMNPGGRPSASAAYTERARQLVAQLPKFLPRVQEMHLTSDGSVWLRRNMANSSKTLWEYYDRNGHRVGALPLEDGVRLVGVERGRIALATTDSNGRITLHLEQVSVLPVSAPQKP